MITLFISKQIETIRTPMLLGVIAIHSNILFALPENASQLNSFSIELFSKYLPMVCVPWFFLISGFLNGNKYDALCIDTYATMMKKRMYGILLPYVLWNMIALIISLIIHPNNILSSFSDYPIGGLLIALEKLLINPIIEPLWFLRNLFVLLMAMPLLKKMIRTNIWMSLLVFLLIENYTFLGGILYFSIGLIVSGINQTTLSKSVTQYGKWALIIYCLIMVSEAALKINTNHIWVVQTLTILIGIAGVSGIGNTLIKCAYLKSNTVFFIYCFHGIISPLIIRICTTTFEQAGINWMICYVFVFCLILSLSYAAYYLAQYLMPKVTMILTGQRNTPVAF